MDDTARSERTGERSIFQAPGRDSLAPRCAAAEMKKGKPTRE
jgi:hypothetical protein